MNGTARRVASRVVYRPDPTAEVRAKYLASSGPDSTRVKVVRASELLVVFGRDAEGRRPTPPWVSVKSLDEAEEKVRAFRESKDLGKTGVRARPTGEKR